MKKKIIIGVVYGLLMVSSVSIGAYKSFKDKHDKLVTYELGSAEMVGKAVEKGKEFHEYKIKAQENNKKVKYQDLSKEEVQKEEEKENLKG